MKNVKVGLLGLGNVGKGTYKILTQNSEKISVFSNSKIEIAKILVSDVNKKRDIDVPKDILTTDAYQIINDPEIDVIVELLGGIDTAYEYIKASIENGKHVVTANKAVIATHGMELMNLAKQNRVLLLHEASVAGGIPIITAMMKPLCGNEFQEIIGIVNGTTNYILTQMSENNMEYEVALKQAQEKGFAEADPTSDVEGEDAAYKLCILMLIAFGVYVDPKIIPREGITKISKEDIEFASQFGYKLKLLAGAKNSSGRLKYYVYPTLVPDSHPLASVNNEFNALFIKGDAVGELMFYGKGAGSMPTGSAVVGDVVSVAKCIGTDLLDVTPSQPYPITEEELELTGESKSMYYINFLVGDEPGALGKVSTTFGNHGISIQSVMQRSRGLADVPVVYILHETKRYQLDDALAEITKNQYVKEITSILRVLS
ncbi:MAG: homoserine dehydrogenase [Firmicutes bacterium]|nr:homoserine dehydrogenase [Clostridiales bacterium]MBQ4339377.1 homoserine dehydrogenase [Bacillota bacterium]